MQLSIGDIVKVTNICDPEGQRVEDKSPRIAQPGMIVSLDSHSQGCGESIESPFVELQFLDGYKAWYWPDEIEMVCAKYECKHLNTAARVLPQKQPGGGSKEVATLNCVDCDAVMEIEQSVIDWLAKNYSKYADEDLS